MMSVTVSGKYDQAVSLTRVLAMLLIVACHIGSYLEFPAAAQFFNVGVPLFLVISGYLYGGKTISSWKVFFAKRWLTLLLPVDLWYAILVAATWLWTGGMPGWKDTLLLLSNLQGMGFVYDGYSSYEPYPGLGHLWFLTVLMLCYMTLPFLQRFRQNIGALDGKCRFLFLIAFLLVSVASSFFLGIHLHYFLAFVLGYFLSDAEKLFSNPHVLLWLMLAAGACLLRLCGKFMFDGTFLYDQVIVVITHLMLAVSIFILIKKLYGCYTSIQDVVCHHRIGGLYLDKYSYYIYLTHYVFLTGVFSAAYLFPEQHMAGVVYVLILTLVLSFILKNMSDRLISLLRGVKP